MKKHSSCTLAIVIGFIIAIAVIAGYIIYHQNLNVENKSEEDLIVYRIEEIRGLKLLEKVPHELISRCELESKYLNESEDKTTELILKALFVIDKNANLHEKEARYSSTHIVAYYDIGEKKIFIVSKYANMTEKIYPHEYEHVLQDQHFNLTKLLIQPSFDKRMASRALIEGDATFVTDLYEGKTPERVSLTVSVSKDLTDRTLKKIRKFPFTMGEKFVIKLYEKGGWDEVNNAFMNPPTTTEQIMHPEKYFSKEWL